MGRKRREITDDGLLICKFDPDNWHAAHYTEFYGWDKPPLDYWFDPVDETWIGRPNAWCAEDQKKYSRTRYRPTTGPVDERVAEALAEYRGPLVDKEVPPSLEEIKERAGKMGPSEPERPKPANPNWKPDYNYQFPPFEEDEA